MCGTVATHLQGIAHGAWGAGPRCRHSGSCARCCCCCRRPLPLPLVEQRLAQQGGQVLLVRGDEAIQVGGGGGARVEVLRGAEVRVSVRWVLGVRQCE